MLLKLGIVAFVVLVFIGLGVNGTMNAASSGYAKVEQNPAVQQIQNKTETAIKAEIHTQLANVENATANAVAAKIGSLSP